MNLIGKIFTVLICVMSLIFLALVVAVYATHTNWRSKIMDPNVGLAKKLEDASALNDELNNKLTKAADDLSVEQADRRQTLSKLENEKVNLQRQLDEMTRKAAEFEQEARDARAAMDAAHLSLEGLRTEVGVLGPDGRLPVGADGQPVKGLRQEIEEVRKEREELFAKVVELTDKLHQAVNNGNALEKRNLELAKVHAGAMQVLRLHGLTAIPGDYDGVTPPVEGIVLASRPGGLLEINIGEDDGLKKGHTLEVNRGPSGAPMYLGRIEVTQVAPDKSVAKVLPQFQQGTIQVGDIVRSQRQ